MPNILDYLAWRGDLSFESSPFCDIDFLVLCRMSYLPFDGVLQDSFAPQGGYSIGEAARRVRALLGEAGDGREVRIKEDITLIELLCSSERFRDMHICGFVNVFDAMQQEQFSAVTVLLPDESAVVAFRGTDGTLVGWKEDFNMALSSAVPAQLDAVAYVERLASAFSGKLRLGGHSKGGNLAVYSAANCSQSTQDRIIEVRNFDGPGFQESDVAKDGFTRVIGRVKTILPQSSIIGMLLEHAEDFSVVESRSVSIFQHNVYMWDVMRNGFTTVSSRTNSSQFIDATLKEWVAEMPPELREKMINGVYSVLSASDSKTLRELWNGKNTLAIFRAMGEMDEETRGVMKEGFRMLRGAMKSSFPALLDSMKSKPSSRRRISPPAGDNAKKRRLGLPKPAAPRVK